MSKDEPGRLFSKMAKFVRNPLKDWSELDADEPGAADNGYSREMLKEMIERRQRNDFVRRREFDMLRKLRRREAAGGRDAVTPSSFNVSSTSGKTEGRALTLKKIDEIEEQMSQQWWKNRGPAGELAADAAAPGIDPARSTDMAAQHARAYADTMPGVTSELAASRTSGEQLPSDGSVEEAAIRFAHGDDAGAEAILLQALASEGPLADQDAIWRTLFDLYRATGDADKFAAFGVRYAQRMRRTAPSWVSLPDLARDARAAAEGHAAPAPQSTGDANWVSPARLTRESLLQLTRALGSAGAVWKLNWCALQSIDADAAGPLRALFTHWADSAVQLRFAGTDQLLLVLAEATPVGERNVEAVRWQLHMAALRMMHRDDEFELLALNYCITYEVSPPPWEDPKGDFAELQATPSADGSARSSASGQPPGAAATEGSQGVLAGALEGESLSTWQRLDGQLKDVSVGTVSCAALVRMDFAAAGTLLNWVTACDARGQRVRFVDAHRLVGAFFTVIGIANHAEVIVRAD